jgi:hypothetical protein
MAGRLGQDVNTNNVIASAAKQSILLFVSPDGLLRRFALLAMTSV